MKHSLYWIKERHRIMQLGHKRKKQKNRAIKLGAKPPKGEGRMAYFNSNGFIWYF